MTSRKMTWNMQIVVKYVMIDIKHEYDVTWNMVVDTCDNNVILEIWISNMKQTGV